MANNPIGVVHGFRMRVARLGANGAPQAGASNSYVSSALVTLGLSPQYEDGDEINEKNGEGVTCVLYKSADTFKWVDFTLEICTPDPYLMEMLAGGSILTNTVDIGYAFPPLGPIQPPPVSIEVWSHRVDNNVVDGVSPYEWWVLPRIQGMRLGDWEIGNSAVKPTITGQVVENSQWGNGPFNDWPAAVASNRVVQMLPTAVAPPAASPAYVVVPVQT